MLRVAEFRYERLEGESWVEVGSWDKYLDKIKYISCRLIKTLGSLVGWALPTLQMSEKYLINFA
jgi:hypothetical protein